MKRLVFAFAALVLATTAAQAQSSSWAIDPMHSSVEFSVKHGGVSNVHGHFGKSTGVLVFNQAEIGKSSVNATIDVTGVDTGEQARDNHLKTDSFFDVAKFPTATFTSTSVVREGSGLKVSGNLTLHGVTKPVVLTVDGPATPVENGMDHKLHSGFEATTTISRTAFGIGTSFPSLLISDEVKLTIELEVVKQ